MSTSDEARSAFESIAGPVVLKGQVLSGGRMKAGAVKFADTADEAAAHFDAIMPVEVKGQKSRSVLVEAKSSITQEYFAAVTWDGRKKRPVLVFSDMGGIDIEEVAETHPDHVSKTHFSTILPLSPRIAKEAIGATGVTGSDLNRLTPIIFELMQIFLRYDLTLAEINPIGKLENGSFVVLDGHVDLEAEARGLHRELLEELGIASDARVISAHRTPDRLTRYMESAETDGIEVVICGAGHAAHLAGVTAAQTTLPVLGVPLGSSALQGLDALLATVQMPGGIPVATFAIGKSGAKNAGLFAAAILAGRDPEIHERLRAFRVAQSAAVPERPD